MFTRAVQRKATSVTIAAACFGFALSLTASALSTPQVASRGNTSQATSPVSGHHGWREGMKHSAPSKTGCFRASYPSNKWEETPCTQPLDLVPPNIPTFASQHRGVVSHGVPVGRGSSKNVLTQSSVPQIGSGSGDFIANTSGGISSAQGSFLQVANLTSVADSQFGSGAFGLQLNANTFAPNMALCGANNCTGWVQFVYQVLPNAASPYAYGAIWYVLEAPSSCPTGFFWDNSSASCYGPFGFNTPITAISQLSEITLEGSTSSGTDGLILTIGDTLYTVNHPSFFTNFAQVWSQAEFNIFGVGSGSTASFNSGASMSIRTSVNNGSTSAPTCISGSTTGEANSMSIISPCCRYGGSEPSIAFVQNNISGSTATCSSVGSFAVTPSASSNGTISPSATANLPGGGVASFAVAPNSGYVANVGGSCGGALNNNVYLTKPVTANCTVSVRFVNIGAVMSALSEDCDSATDPSCNE